MLNKPTRASRNTPDHNKHAKYTTLRTAQHGKFHQNLNPSSLQDRRTPILDVPGESLTHITSYLDVPSLLNLSRVNKSLHQHMNNDSTWYRALLCQYLGISPESDLQEARSLMLRRTESTWKKELIYRNITSVRWERSRTSAITYSPLAGRIDDIRLVSEGTLLAASTQHGIVSRSNPLSGRVLRGLLDATGALNGLGIGNQNAEFPPNVCLCRIFTKGSTAKILWGFSHGEVAVTIARKVADPSRTSPAKFARSPISEQHNGAITDGIWDQTGDVFLTAGIDGKVKLWDAAKMRCLWASPTIQDLPSPTSYPLRIDFDSQQGIVVAAFSGGDTIVWWGLLPFFAGGDVPQVNQVTVPSESQPPPAGVSHFVLNTGDRISLLVHHLDRAYFHRLDINLATGEVETTKFGEAENRSINSLKLVTAQATAPPFVLVGDWLGSLSVYNWNSSCESGGDFVSHVRRIAAFGDGDAVSSIEWNPWVVVTGSSMGVVKVWDSLKFTLLRTFQSQARDHTGVPSIALDREMIVIAFGNKVTAWKAGPVRRGNKVIHSSKKGKSNALAKWRQQVDMYSDISESRREIEEEQSRKRAAHGREKGHLGSLEALGLNEQEALEYVLMLSRDEERRGPASENPPTLASFTQSRPVLPPPNAEAQTIPSTDLEAWPAGTAGSPGSPEMARSASTCSDLSDEREFPTMSEKASSRGSSIGGTTTPVKSQRSSGSPPNAWNTPLKTSPRYNTVSPKSIAAAVSVSPSTSFSVPGRVERVHRSTACQESQEDRDLKLAIELSLAEAAKK